MPDSIINVNRNNLKSGAKLSDFISLSQNTGVAVITIKKDGVHQYELKGFLLHDFMNYIESTAFTAYSPMNGIIGAIEQVQDTLFLKDGYYSLWSHDTANPPANQKLPNTNQYTVNPFFMAKS